MRALKTGLVVLLSLAALRADANDVPFEDRACQRLRHPGLAEGPVVIGLYDADLGTARRTCLRSELSIGERFGVTIDNPDFYGGVRADTLVQGSVRLRPYLELFGALELVRWQFAQNATIKAATVSIGQLTMGLQGMAYEGRGFALSAYGRVLLPTDTSSPSVQTTGAELGLSGLWRPRRDVELHAQLAGDFTVGVSAGPAQVRGGSTLSLGTQYAPASWFALAVDLQLVLGHRGALDAVLPQLALRFRAWRGLNIELAATGPIAGEDRRLAVGLLRLGYRF